MARHAPSRGAPARLACLVLLALVAAVCLFVTASAAPAACPVAANGTLCVGCAPKSCKFDDNCHFNNLGQARRGFCQDLSDGEVVGPTDRCSGVQRKHGKKAPESVGGPGKKKKRCLDKSVSRPGFSAVACECVNKKGNNVNKEGQPVKKCKRCQQSAPLTVPAPPPPPNPNGTPSPPPPPVVPTDAFLPNNLMTMQGGAVTYTPSNANGNWTVLCQIPAQAKAVAYGAGLTPAGGTKQADAAWLQSLWSGSIQVPGLSTLYGDSKTTYSTDILNEPFFMAGTTYYDAAASWYKNGLPPDTSTSPPTSTGGMAPPDYLGNGKDFLDNYFRSGIQIGGSGTLAPSGSSDNAANAQILKKSSAYWVATTHLQYNLDMAEINIAANRTTEAKANMDSAAAAYFGCGDTNPVPLPKYKGTQITYPTSLASGDTDTGSNATTMSIYGVANKRAVNYKTGKQVPGTASPTSPLTTKAVAELNIEVGQAFNAATPTAATVQAIRDATNTIFAQAAQRYIAKITLSGHMPGNGMGGSTNIAQAITTPATNPTTGYWKGTAGWGIWDAADKKQATACGGLSVQMPNSITPADAAKSTIGPTTNSATSTSLKMNGGLACNKMTSGDGTAVSNTAQFRTVNPEVFMSGSGSGTGTTNCPDKPGTALAPNCGAAAGAGGRTGSQPYVVALTEAYKNDAETKNGGLTNDQIKKATRGLAQSATAPAITVTPTACIGPSVIFNDVVNSGKTDGANTDNTKQGVALCDPQGLVPATKVRNAANDADVTTQNPLPAASQTYAVNKAWYSGTKGGNKGVPLNIQKFWDPITAAQASGGAFCCDALYYGQDGLGRGTPTNDPPIEGVTKNADFKPIPLVGAAMDLEVVPGGVCTDGKPTTSVKEGLSDATNVAQESFLEGQAFYACVAPSMYVLPKVNSVAVTQAANEAKQKKCAETLTNMLRMNRVAAGISTDNAACKEKALVIAGSTAASPNSYCSGTGYSAVDYPLWMVEIGGGTTPATYAVPNGYCYANACLEDFAAVGTATAFKGATKLSTLQSSPDMSSNPTTTTNSCGRANAACAAPPSTWSGAPATFQACTKTAGDEIACTLAEKQGQTGMLPSA